MRSKQTCEVDGVGSMAGGIDDAGRGLVVNGANGQPTELELP